MEELLEEDLKTVIKNKVIPTLLATGMFTASGAALFFTGKSLAKNTMKLGKQIVNICNPSCKNGVYSFDSNGTNFKYDEENGIVRINDGKPIEVAIKENYFPY